MFHTLIWHVLFVYAGCLDTATPHPETNEMDAQIARTTQSLTTADEMRNTTHMLMQPNANWEEYLTPAPHAIAIMGELVFISSSNDFSINKNPPPGGFKYIRYPESFRACLMQVCNSCWHAFNLAHKNMDRIRIHTASVPDYMKTAVKILFQGNEQVVQTLLPSQLENIRNIANECVILAESVEKKYTDVINIIQELLEASINAQNVYEEELEKVRMKLNETKMREETAKYLNERSKKAIEAMSMQLDEAQDQYKKAMDSLPSGWEMIGMDFVDGLSQSVTGVLNGYLTMVASPVKLSSTITQAIIQTQQNSKDEDVDRSDRQVSEIRICSKSGELFSLTSSLTNYISEDGIDWKGLYDQRRQVTKTIWTQSQFERILEGLKKMPESKLRKTALSLCEGGIAICQELKKYAADQNITETETQNLINDTQKLYDDALKFDSMSKSKCGDPALAPKPPMMYKTEQSSGKQSASQRTAENARFRIEQSREQLKQTRESYEKSVENMEKNLKELTDILVEMQSAKIKEIDFNTTVRMLVKGLDAMGRVKEQWEKMVRFLEMVANVVNISLNTTLRNFVTTSEVTQKLSYNNKLFTLDILYKQAFQASNIVSLVHMISGTYCEVSNQYLMDRVSSLGRIMAMDKDKPEFMQERLQLQESCKEAQEGILQLVMKNKRDFERKTEARMAQIEGGLNAVLPPAKLEETNKIKQIVQAGFKEGGAEDYI